MNDDYSRKMMQEFVEGLKNGDLDWHHLAACAETDPEAFFPTEGDSQKPPKLVCQGCPVRVDCLEYALRNKEEHGIWGGLSAHQRKKLLQKRNGLRPQGRPRKENEYAELSS